MEVGDAAEPRAAAGRGSHHPCGGVCRLRQLSRRKQRERDRGKHIQRLGLECLSTARRIGNRQCRYRRT